MSGPGSAVSRPVRGSASSRAELGVRLRGASGPFGLRGRTRAASWAALRHASPAGLERAERGAIRPAPLDAQQALEDAANQVAREPEPGAHAESRHDAAQESAAAAGIGLG